MNLQEDRQQLGYRFGRLDGKVIVVTGVENALEERHGIGASTSIQLARHGATVISVSNIAENCELVADSIRKDLKVMLKLPIALQLTG